MCHRSLECRWLEVVKLRLLGYAFLDIGAHTIMTEMVNIFYNSDPYLELVCSSDAWAESVIRLAWLGCITEPCSRLMSRLELFRKEKKKKFNCGRCAFVGILVEVVVPIEDRWTSCKCECWMHSAPPFERRPTTVGWVPLRPWLNGPKTIHKVT